MRPTIPAIEAADDIPDGIAEMCASVTDTSNKYSAMCASADKLLMKMDLLVARVRTLQTERDVALAQVRALETLLLQKQDEELTRISAQLEKVNSFRDSLRD